METRILNVCLIEAETGIVAVCLIKIETETVAVCWIKIELGIICVSHTVTFWTHCPMKIKYLASQTEHPFVTLSASPASYQTYC